MLDYEKLDVYQCSIDFLALSWDLLQSLPRGSSQIADQLKRTSISIPLNIAEGSGKTTAADKSRYYAIARGSAMECGALLDVCLVMKLLENPKYSKGKSLLVRIVSMLSKMSR